MKRLHVFINGKVIGVFFRNRIKGLALKLKINGWVRNTLDGKVEAIFEGDKNDLEKMLEFCNKGPLGSKVDKVEVKEEDVEFEKDFKIKW